VRTTLTRKPGTRAAALPGKVCSRQPPDRTADGYAYGRGSIRWLGADQRRRPAREESCRGRRGGMRRPAPPVPDDNPRAATLIRILFRRARARHLTYLSNLTFPPDVPKHFQLSRSSRKRRSRYRVS
jgi:hypothetical protein